jgi:hypothetical protein
LEPFDEAIPHRISRVTAVPFDASSTTIGAVGPIASALNDEGMNQPVLIPHAEIRVSRIGPSVDV